MLKCYITGIELNEETASVIDTAKVLHIIRALKNKYDGLNKLINELGLCDNVEIVNTKGKKIKQKRKRLICKQLADAYCDTYSEKNIFVSWKEWLVKTKRNKNKNHINDR